MSFLSLVRSITVWPIAGLVILLTLPYNLLGGLQLQEMTPGGAPLLVYTPDSYHPGKQHPLLVFLHGEEQAGNDMRLLTGRSAPDFPAKLIAAGRWDKSLPFIVVTPQLAKPLRGTPAWSAASVNEIVEFVQRKYNVDASRIYLTGVSIGATACWKYATTFPAKVAAIIPVSGPADKNAAPMKDIPVWAFHGENDHLYLRSTVEAINSIKNSKGKFVPRLSLLPAKARNAWAGVFDRDAAPSIYSWALMFKKGSRQNIPPYVSAGSTKTLTVTPGAIHIAGDFFDWDGKVTAVKWKQTAGVPLILQSPESAMLSVVVVKDGTYDFELRVVDNGGAATTSRVRVNVVSPTSGPAITGLVLVDGRTDTDISSIADGMVIDKSIVSTEFNVKAVGSPAVRSVQFTVNADPVTRIVSSAPFMVRPKSSSPEWIPGNGNCVICATPFSDVNGKGMRGPTKCYKVVFSESTPDNSLTVVDVPLRIRMIDNILVSNMGSGNQWVYNGNDIPGATGPIYQPLYPGKYYVRQPGRAVSDVSNIVNYGKMPEAVRAPKIDVLPNLSEGFIQVKAQSLPPRSSYRLMRGDVTIQQGELFDNRITLSSPLPKGDYKVIVNGKRDDDGTMFRIR